MVTTAKTPAKSAVKPAVKAAVPASARSVRTSAPAKARQTAASAEPSLRFYHSKALRTKTNAVLAGIEAKPDLPQHGNAMADLVTELIEAGMDYYFLKALKQAEVGFVTEQSARLGMSGAVKLISSVSRKFITRMDQSQLLIVASHIRSLAVAP